MIACFADSAIC